METLDKPETRYCETCKQNTFHNHTGTLREYICHRHNTEYCKDQKCSYNKIYEDCSEWKMNSIKRYTCQVCVDKFVKKGLARLEKIKQMKCIKCEKQGHESFHLNNAETELVCGDCFICNVCNLVIDLNKVGGYAKYRETDRDESKLAHIKCYENEFGKWKMGYTRPPPLYISTETKFKTPKDALSSMANVVKSNYSK